MDGWLCGFCLKLYLYFWFRLYLYIYIFVSNIFVYSTVGYSWMTGLVGRTRRSIRALPRAPSGLHQIFWNKLLYLFLSWSAFLVVSLLGGYINLCLNHFKFLIKLHIPHIGQRHHKQCLWRKILSCCKNTGFHILY